MGKNDSSLPCRQYNERRDFGVIFLIFSTSQCDFADFLTVILLSIHLNIVAYPSSPGTFIRGYVITLFSFFCSHYCWERSFYSKNTYNENTEWSKNSKHNPNHTNRYSPRDGSTSTEKKNNQTRPKKSISALLAGFNAIY